MYLVDLAQPVPVISVNRVSTYEICRHVKQGKIYAVKCVGPKCFILKPSSLVSVTACQGKAKLLSVKG